MKAIYDAIVTKYNTGTALKAANTGGLWYDDPAQNTAFPYIAYYDLSGEPEYTFKENMERVQIQFSIWGKTKSKATVLDIYDKLIALFDWCTLTLTGYTSIYMKRISTIPLESEDKEVFGKGVIYDIEVIKN